MSSIFLKWTVLLWGSTGWLYALELWVLLLTDLRKPFGIHGWLRWVTLKVQGPKPCQILLSERSPGQWSETAKASQMVARGQSYKKVLTNEIFKNQSFVYQHVLYNICRVDFEYLTIWIFNYMNTVTKVMNKSGVLVQLVLCSFLWRHSSIRLSSASMSQSSLNLWLSPFA